MNPVRSISRSVAASVLRRSETPEATLDDFIGTKYTPGKRIHSSLEDERSPKIPRLSLRGDIEKDLEASQQQLRDSFSAELGAKTIELQTRAERWQEELGSAIQQHMDSLSSDWLAVMKTEFNGNHTAAKADTTQFLTKLTDMLNASSNQVKQKLSSMTTELTTELSTWRSDVVSNGDRLRSEMVETLAGWNKESEARDDRLRAQLRQEMVSFSADLKRDISSTAAEIIESSKPPLRRGQDGYLTAHCPALPGFQQDEYVAQLERAAWHYIFLLENPDEVVALDEIALK